MAARTAYSSARRQAGVILGIVGGGFALFLAYLFFTHLVWFLILIVPSVVAALTVMAGTLYLIRRRFLKSHRSGLEASGRPPTEDSALKSALSECIEPFFSRNCIRPRSPVAAGLEERSMLAKILEKRGIAVPEERMLNFLTSCRLRLDYSAFHEQIAHDVKMGRSEGQAFSGYKAEHGGKDSTPFLQEYYARMARTISRQEIDAMLAASAQREKEAGFEEDLKARRGGQSVNVTITAVDGMDPYDFELLVGMIYRSKGYLIEETPKSGDQGADVIVSKGGRRTVIQTKLYADKVDNSAVQQAHTAMGYWGCQAAAVVTNNFFTPSAIDLARSNNVDLIDREKLELMIEEFNKSPKDYPRLRELLRKGTGMSSPTTDPFPGEGDERRNDHDEL